MAARSQPRPASLTQDGRQSQPAVCGEAAAAMLLSGSRALPGGPAPGRTIPPSGGGRAKAGPRRCLGPGRARLRRERGRPGPPGRVRPGGEREAGRLGTTRRRSAGRAGSGPGRRGPPWLEGRAPAAGRRPGLDASGAGTAAANGGGGVSLRATCPLWGRWWAAAEPPRVSRSLLGGVVAELGRVGWQSRTFSAQTGRGLCVAERCSRCRRARCPE